MASNFRISRCARLLDGGAVVAYPTEAVYGLGCDPLNAEAVARLLALKARAPAQGLILIAADAKVLEPYVALRAGGALTRNRVAEILASWPGPLTWVLPAEPGTPDWLTGGRGTLAVRVTAHPGARELCRAFGAPIVSTSANISGRRPARTALQVRRMFGAGLDAVLGGEVGTSPRPTEIRDAVTGDVLRHA